ncbi:MAG: hypothetical protein FJX53_06300 [Alphaproteobacteria bacterium]|nr:hypothetical protein [Alphaproteobacteria bacterium]
MNPEFRRQLWLKFTGRRLAVTAVVLALILGTAWAINPEFGSEAFGLLVGYGLLYLWGTKLAAGSLLDEVGEGT